MSTYIVTERLTQVWYVKAASARDAVDKSLDRGADDVTESQRTVKLEGQKRGRRVENVH